jgi:hypothetical protein
MKVLLNDAFNEAQQYVQEHLLRCLVGDSDL